MHLANDERENGKLMAIKMTAVAVYCFLWRKSLIYLAVKNVSYFTLKRHNSMNKR